MLKLKTTNNLCKMLICVWKECIFRSHGPKNNASFCYHLLSVFHLPLCKNAIKMQSQFEIFSLEQQYIVIIVNVFYLLHLQIQELNINFFRISINLRNCVPLIHVVTDHLISCYILAFRQKHPTLCTQSFEPYQHLYQTWFL